MVHDLVAGGSTKSNPLLLVGVGAIMFGCGLAQTLIWGGMIWGGMLCC